MSIKEMQYKILSKGIDKEKIEDYINKNRDLLIEYEQQSAKNIVIKKQSMIEKNEIIKYLNKKGYLPEIIKGVFDE